jgi:lipopolysaccharide export system protein LptA
MKVKIISISCTIFLLLAIAAVHADDNIDKTSKFNSKEPIEILSDRMEAFNQKQMVVFSGNAVVKQADWVLKTDRLTLYYKKEAGKQDKSGAKEIGGAVNLEKIEATGNVIVTQKMKVATSDAAVYFQESAQIIMTGNPVIREKKNIIKGCKVTIYLNEDRGLVEKCEGKKVSMEIHPEEKDENKK